MAPVITVTEQKPKPILQPLQRIFSRALKTQRQNLSALPLI